MSTPGWRKHTSVTQKLIDSASEYPFLQAVRLLERAAVMSQQEDEKNIAQNLSHEPLAGFVPPSREFVRFSSFQTLAFPSSEIKKLEKDQVDSLTHQWHLIINLIGLSGSTGVLPFHYTELILKRQKNKDENLEHFLNLFNHRTTSLFYRAATKYRLPLQYEQNFLQKKSGKDQSSPTGLLLSLIGLGNNSLQHRLVTNDESLLYYSGLFAQKVKTAANLQQILRSHFKIPVEVKQFVGQWHDMIDDVRTRLPDIERPQGCNVQLGKTAMLGKSGWFSQGKIDIILGPLNRTQLKTFEPGTDGLTALNELVRMYLGIEHDYDFIIRINKKDIPDKIQLSKISPPIVGWNTWLHSRRKPNSTTDETVDISVSASRLK